jgi:hypothetical protein
LKIPVARNHFPFEPFLFPKTPQKNSRILDVLDTVSNGINNLVGAVGAVHSP